MEKQKDSLSVVVQQHGDAVPRTKIFEGRVDDHLLILAHSAEIVALSEDSVVGMHTNIKIKDMHNGLVDHMSQEYVSNVTADDQGCSGELLDRLPMVSHGSNEGCGFHSDVTRTRLTQIRKQARCKHLVLDQVRDKDNHYKRSQGKTIRLSQIKHQARCLSKNDFSLQMITASKNVQPRSGKLRLSQIKRRARSKGNSTVKQGMEELMDVSLHCNRIEDNKEKVIAKQFVKKGIFQEDSNLSVVEGLPAHNFFTRASQPSVAAVRWDNETLKGHQHTARRLRALKTKKLRQKLRTNSPWLSNSATLQKEKDLISFRQELPKTSGYNEKLRADFGADELHGFDESALTCKSLRHIPNGHPMQNNKLPITGLPNYIFQQCNTNLRWMLYMPNIQHKKYHQAVAPDQQMAECFEEKRELKNKPQNPKNPPLANLGAQEEFIPVERLRLTQLRRKARLGNQYSVIQGRAAN